MIQCNDFIDSFTRTSDQASLRPYCLDYSMAICWLNILSKKGACPPYPTPSPNKKIHYNLKPFVICKCNSWNNWISAHYWVKGIWVSSINSVFTCPNTFRVHLLVILWCSQQYPNTYLYCFFGGGKLAWLLAQT